MRPGPAGLTVPGASPARPVPGGTLERLADCPHFRAEVLELSGLWERTADEDTFHSLLCLDGTAALRVVDHDKGLVMYSRMILERSDAERYRL